MLLIIPCPQQSCWGVYWFHSIRMSLHLRRLFVHGLFVSWGATGSRFVINSRANIHVTIDCSTVLPHVLGVVTKQKLQMNGSVVLGADESPWHCGTPSWYTPLSWMILSKQKNLHLFYHNTFVFSLRRLSIHPSHIWCLLCSTYSSGWINFIFTYLNKQLQKVCYLFEKFLQNWNFWHFFKICYFDCVFFDFGSDVNP